MSSFIFSLILLLFQIAFYCVDTAKWMHYMDTNKRTGEEAWRQLHKNSASNIEQVLGARLRKAAAVWSLTTHHENYSS